MVNYLNLQDEPSNAELYLLSDIHVGGKDYHREGFESVIAEVRRKRNARVLLLGDYVVGQTTNHPHYEHPTIDDGSDEGYDLHTPDGQFQMFQDTIEPIASKTIGALKGNHDWRYDKVRPFVNFMCRDLGITYLGPMAHITYANTNIHAQHIGRRYKNSAGSPAQQQENMKESLRRFFTKPEDHWASANLMVHGHSHQLLVAEPVEQESVFMMDSKGRHRMRTVKPSIRSGHTEDGFQYVDPYARWYAVSGTFERSGELQHVDAGSGWDTWESYPEKFGLAPTPPGYVKVTIRDGDIRGVEKVFV